MVAFHGRPFLEYLINQLRSEGIRKILILGGYLSEKITDHFGDGRNFGVQIDYSISPVETETGLRLRNAYQKLDSEFLLLYCDNYCPLPLAKMYDSFKASESEALFAVYANRDGYTKNNVFFDSAAKVLTYDKTRQTKDLNGVEIGYAFIKKQVINNDMPAGNVSFEATVYPELVKRKSLSCYATEHRYYSVGSIERLPLTEKFLSFPKVVFLDRDGVLNQKPPKADYVKKWEEFTWLPGAIEALQLLKKAGYKLMLISNQPGIGRNIMTEADLADIHQRMQASLKKYDATIDHIYYCPHAWDAGCDCRKPKAGMLFQAQKEHHLDLTKTYFVGDDERDLIAGNTAGCPTCQISAEYPLLQWAKDQSKWRSQ